ncbi:hypothetical protein GAY20_16370 [Pantoea dispersa]|nr:hypothetical protein GAY20_16370 [Pantoea dispersa]
MLCHGTVCVVGKIRDLILQLSKSSIYSTKPSPGVILWRSTALPEASCRGSFLHSSSAAGNIPALHSPAHVHFALCLALLTLLRSNSAPGNRLRACFVRYCCFYRHLAHFYRLCDACLALRQSTPGKNG